MKNIKRIGLALASVFAVVAANAQTTTVEVIENVTTDTVWTADNEYLLTQIIYVEPGASLTIAPGTVIRGRISTAGEFNPGALVVSRGAKLFANGTPSAPIVMTSELDIGLGDLPYGVMNKDIRGQWGGLILLGDAPTNLPAGSGNAYIEGLPESDLSNFGGDNADDSSGSISYLSILHGGAKLASDNEINGLTLGGVGRGTCIHHVEIYSNLDDGIEWFGGTVNMKYVAVAYCGDDGFDTDYGWNGTVQFGFEIMSDSNDVGDKGSEQDSGKSSDDAEPVGMAKFYNMTIIGDGISSADGGTKAAIWRDNAANNWINSIFTDFSGGAFQFEDRDGKADSYDRLVEGDLMLANNIIGLFGAGSTFAELVTVDDDDDGHVDLAAQAAAIIPTVEATNAIANPAITSISRVRDGGLNPVATAAEVTEDLYEIPARDAFLKDAGYKGAFDPAAEATWLAGWSALAQLGYLAE